MKKLLSIILSAATLMCFVAGNNVSSYALESSGKCGDNVTYTFDSSTGTVTISGSGEMYNYSSQAEISYSPFYNNSKIKTVNIKGNVSNVGMDMFFGCTSLNTVTMSNSIKNLVQGCFWGCTSLNYIELPNNLDTIGMYTFVGCTSLDSIYIPESLSEIQMYAFDHDDYGNGNCKHLSIIYYQGSRTGYKNLSIDSYNDCLNSADVIYNYNINVSNQWGFSNFSKSIDEKYYYNIFSKPQAWLIINALGRLVGKGGNCYGMAYSSSLTYDDTKSWVNATDIHSVTKRITALNKKLKYADSVYDMIAYCHLYQMSKMSTKADKNNKDCNKMINEIKSNGKDRVLLTIGCSYGYHAVLAHSVDKVSDNKWDISVYDSNYPNKYNHLIITKSNSGKYTYSMFFTTNKKGEKIYFNKDLSYLVIQPKGELYKFLTNGTKISTDAWHDVIFSCDANIEDNNHLEKINTKNALLDDEGYPVESDDKNLYYLNEEIVTNSNQISFENKDKNIYNNFSMATNKNIYSLNVNSNSTVDYTVEDKKFSSLAINGTDKATVSYGAVVDNRIINFDFSGTSESNVVKVNNNNSVIEIEGLDKGSSMKISSEDGNTDVVTKTINSNKTKIEISNGSIDLLTDTNNDGKYDKTETIAKVCNHIYTSKITTAATCVKAGVETHTCSVCGHKYSSTVKAKGHKPVTDKAVSATFRKHGKTAGRHCSVCGVVIKKQTSIKKLGSPKLSKVTAAKKAFTAKWAEVSGIDGYQIRYSLKSNMKASKTISLANTATSKKVKKLKAKKIYYVQIRAYKTVNGKKLYSSWSAKKKVKTK